MQMGTKTLDKHCVENWLPVPSRKVLMHLCTTSPVQKEYDFHKVGYVDLLKNNMGTLPSICHTNHTHILEYKISYHFYKVINGTLESSNRLANS